MAKMYARAAKCATETVFIPRATITPPPVGSTLCYSAPNFLDFSEIIRVLASLDERCKRMDDLCHRMETMMERFSQVVAGLEGFGSVAHVSVAHSPHQRSSQHNSVQPNLDHLGFSEVREDDQVEMEEMDDEKHVEETAPAEVQDHVMTTDSYGKLRYFQNILSQDYTDLDRYVGGTGTMVMIEALKCLSSDSGSANSPMTSAESRQPEKSLSILELPFFVRGQTWPVLPYLPKVEEVVRPPRYVSDLLINLYFDQLHFTMPVIYKPHFIQRYNILLNERTSANIDIGFLSVFFAVCACASSLLPREPGSSPMFAGIQYYESALLLHFKSTGEGSIEQVQCLALLSMCTAGWNTLAQSWKFAGQAVRAAQDLGLHVSLNNIYPLHLY
jgi:hypothetical protein